MWKNDDLWKRYLHKYYHSRYDSSAWLYIHKHLSLEGSYMENQVATTDQYVVDFALYPNPTDFKTLEP